MQYNGLIQRSLHRGNSDGFAKFQVDWTDEDCTSGYHVPSLIRNLHHHGPTTATSSTARERHSSTPPTAGTKGCAVHGLVTGHVGTASMPLGLNPFLFIVQTPMVTEVQSRGGSQQKITPKAAHTELFLR
ncbi:uncharacterized protein LOC144168843 [Haemaphysalis longicornis]